MAALLGKVGIEATILESHPGRASVVARIAGEDSSRPALMMHGHLDVMQANAADWGRSTRSPGRSATGASGAGARST